jgi:hypothetical protein
MRLEEGTGGVGNEWGGGDRWRRKWEGMTGEE